MGYFKAYDIRGVYGKDFGRDEVYRIGRHLPALLDADRVVIGRDARLSSPEIFNTLSAGITESGADVYDMGLATTPMVYFATAHGGFPASVQITASHNGPEYNGLKISRAAALPVGIDSGLDELRNRVETATLPPVSSHAGAVHSYTAKADYLSFLRRYMEDTSGLRFGVDCSNGMASILIRDLVGTDVPVIFETLDGSFREHSPNPLAPGSSEPLEQLVREQGLDVGIVFDGDADRVMFVDECARFIRPDLITAVLARYVTARTFLCNESATPENPPVILHDIRTSRGVTEYIRQLGATPYMWKVGHAFAKVKMREIGAVIGGELAGHYYFRDFFCCDSAMLAMLIVLNVCAALKKEGRTFSELIADFDRYHNSGEINIVMPDEDKPLAIKRLREHFSAIETPLAFFDFDGERLEFADWWYNVRPSNTEPYLRLVIEANAADLLEKRVAEARSIIENG